MKKVKILYIITKQDVGGVQKYVNDLAENLDKNRFEAKIVYGGRDVRWLSNKTYPWFLFANDWLAIFELAKIYKKERPGIVHLNSSKAGVIGAIAAAIYKREARSEKREEEKKEKGENRKLFAFRSSLSSPRIVFTAHGWVFNPTNALSWPARWFYILLHKFAALFQDKIICVSEYDYNLALRYGVAPKEKLVMIHNGIDPEIKFLEKETARKEIIMRIRRFNDTDNKQSASSALNKYYPHYNMPWIGSIGRLVKEKNYETFIRAAAEIERKAKSEKRKASEQPIFVLIGEGLESEKLKAKSSKLKANVFFVEPSGDDAKYLKAFDVFVMSSIKEGLPYILLEAMAAGLPIVVTEAGGIPEMIKNHENGLMVAQKNPEQLAIAVQGILENKNIAKELAEQARKAVEEKFSLEEMVEKTAGIYIS